MTKMEIEQLANDFEQQAREAALTVDGDQGERITIDADDLHGLFRDFLWRMNGAFVLGKRGPSQT